MRPVILGLNRKRFLCGSRVSLLTEFATALSAAGPEAKNRPPAFAGRREAVLAAVRASPGMTIQEIADRVGCGHASAAYHLASLVSAGLVTQDRDGRTVRHFVPGATVTVHEQQISHALSDERLARIIGFVLRAPRSQVNPNEIREAVGLYYNGVRRDLRRLTSLGLLQWESRNSNRHWIKATVRLRAFLERPKPSIDDV